MNRIRPISLAACLAATLAALATVSISGCFFGSDDAPKSNQGGSWDDFPNPSANMCGDISPAQMKTADSLLGQIGPRTAGEIKYFSNDSIPDWEDVKARDIETLQGRYATALKAAPNHCGALFGHAVTTAFSVLNDSRLDSLVGEAERTGGFGGMPALAKVGKEGPAPTLFRLKRGLAGADRSLLTLAREISEQTLLPRLDTAIAALAKVDTNLNFEFDIVDADGDTLRLDRGELGPIMAGLRLLRVAVYLIVAYEWQAESGDDYPHFQVLQDIKDGDFDSLTAAQEAALRHYVDLSKASSPFTRIRAGWAPRLASIPDELVRIVQHLQDGLAYGVRQAELKDVQSKDPYVVGTGEDSDIDPADLKRGIADLEKLKKYLRGVTPIAYNDGQDTLHVDIPRFFRVDGFQKFLPRHVVNPFPEWNDSVETLEGRTVNGPIYFTDLTGAKTMEGYELVDVVNLSELEGRILFDDPTFGGVFPRLTNETVWITLEGLGAEAPRFTETCVEDEFFITCTRSLPPNPSDLDILVDWIGSLGF